MGFFLYWCYIAFLLCYSYVCLYYHACLHYVNKKWSDKDTDCTCCVYCILKCLHSLHSLNHKNLSFPWIYDILNFFFFWVFVSDDFTLSPLGIRQILKRLNKVWLHFSWNSSDLHFSLCLKKCIMVSTKILSSTVVNIYLNLLWCNSTHKAMAKYLGFFVGWMLLWYSRYNQTY